MKYLTHILLITIIFSVTTKAQIAINEDNSQPDASAILDVKSTTKGVLVPRMTSTDRANITSPAIGLLVYDTTTKSFWFYDGGWNEISLSTLQDADNDTKLRAEEDFIGIDIAGEVLGQILQLQGVTYEWNDNKTGNIRPEGIQYGFTAQNIQDVFPTLVDEDNTGYLQTAYGTYDAMTVEAIRALNDKITALEKENEVLKSQVAKINQLETMMAELQIQIQGNNIAENSEN